MAGFTPRDKKRDRDYTEKQQYILDNVVTKHNGDVIAAAVAAGYKNPYGVAKELKEELIQIAEDILALNLIKANLKQVEIMESDAPIPDAGNKLKAALAIKDHVTPKVQKIEIDGELKGGVFILPNKKPMDEKSDEQNEV